MIFPGRIRWRQDLRRHPQDVGGHAAGNDVQVGADAGPSGIKPRCRQPKPHEGLLYHLLGQPRVPEYLQAEAVQAPAVPAVKLRHGGFDFPGGYLGYQLCLLGSAAVLGVDYQHEVPTTFLRRSPAGRFTVRHDLFNRTGPVARRPRIRLPGGARSYPLVTVCREALTRSSSRRGAAALPIPDRRKN